MTEQQDQESAGREVAEGFENQVTQGSAPGSTATSEAFERIRANAKALGAGPFDWEQFKADRDAGRKF